MFQPASNLALARGIVRRQALMFGVKQSAIPLATLVAGALVPLVAFQFGWRWAFGTAGIVSFALIPVVPRQIGASRSRNGRRHGDHGDVPTSPLVWLAIATGFGTAGATAMATFLVDTGAHYGMSVTRAGWLLVAGSTAGIAARLIVGGLADHPRSRALPIVSGMLLLGGVGYGAISLGAPWLVVVGSIAGYAFGWGWTGLMMFAVVRLNPNAPAAASGIVTVGAAGGAALGPLAFGLLVTHFSYEVAWRTSASTTVLAAGLVLIARRWILQHRGDARPVG